MARTGERPLAGRVVVVDPGGADIALAVARDGATVVVAGADAEAAGALAAQVDAAGGRAAVFTGDLRRAADRVRGARRDRGHRVVGAVLVGVPGDQVLGTVYLDLVSLRARSVNTVRRLAAGNTVGPEASADKLLLGACEQSVYDAARSLLGAGFLFGEASRPWREDWWFSRSTTVYGGSAEVQRGIIADRVLKLPRG